MDLSGKAAIVTGASSGIGEKIAERLAERGVKLTLVARREDRLRAVAERLAGVGSEDPLVAVADMRSEEEIRSVFDRSIERWGLLDVLINNAGLGRFGSWHEGATEDWREMLDVNCLSVAIATREALARFPEDGGHVVNMSSMAGHRVPPGGGFYAATKHFVRGMTEALRQELRATGSRTRVSSISPGFVTTEFREVYYRGDRDKVAETRPQFQVLERDDVASAVLYVLEAPDHVAVHDVLMRSNEQPS
jgi:NADP-dependent 3-hydroxy acid dehydrogenase YdfG